MITAGIGIKIAFLISVSFIWLMIIYQIVMTVAGYIHRIKSDALTTVLLETGGPLPPVSVIIPARNEEMVIKGTLDAMRKLLYPGGRLEFVVIDDGSTDRTAEIVTRIADVDRRVKLVQLRRTKQGHGKAGALNRALQGVRNDIIAVYDADNRPEPKSLEILVRRLMADDGLGAALGKIRTVNRYRNLLTRFINMETLAFQWIIQAGRCALSGQPL